MFDSFINSAISLIMGLFIIAIFWNLCSDTIKDALSDFLSMFKKK